MIYRFYKTQAMDWEAAYKWMVTLNSYIFFCLTWVFFKHWLDFLCFIVIMKYVWIVLALVTGDVPFHIQSNLHKLYVF